MMKLKNHKKMWNTVGGRKRSQSLLITFEQRKEKAS